MSEHAGEHLDRVEKRLRALPYFTTEPKKKHHFWDSADTFDDIGAAYAVYGWEVCSCGRLSRVSHILGKVMDTERHDKFIGYLDCDKETMMKAVEQACKD